MNLRIRRRRFGQIAIASAASAAITKLAGKASAQQQQPQLILYGVSLSSAGNTASTDAKLAPATDARIEATTDANRTPGVVVISSDLVSGRDLATTEVASVTVSNPNTRTEATNKAIYTQANERLTAFAALPGGSFVIASVASTRTGNFNRILFTDSKSTRAQRAIKASGFKRVNGTIESLVATQENKLIGAVSLREGTPPFDLVNLDLNSASLSSSADLPLLPGNLRISNLAQAPNGTIYATILSSQNATTLVQIDLKNRAMVSGRGKIVKLSELKYENKPLENDLLSLAVSQSGQVFALANLTNEKTNSLFTVDVKSGEMKLLRKFAADKIAFARP
jgi:hypothetical protein